MNVLPSPSSPEPIGQTTLQEGPAALSAIRALRRAGEDMQERPQRPPAVATPEQQEEAISRLNNRAEMDQGLTLRGKRALAAYGALDQADEQAYMKQVLGFEAKI